MAWLQTTLNLQVGPIGNSLEPESADPAEPELRGVTLPTRLTDSDRPY